MWDQLTICSIRIQCFQHLYSIHEAFDHGTIFCELNKPFVGACPHE
ncbi:spore coat associated protein CotJA [Merdibacter massiliensis]|nr:spore coat associated protein CotJA [Merdibacter massiliensis]